MTGETNLSRLLASLSPRLNPGRFVFCSVPQPTVVQVAAALGSFREAEGTTGMMEGFAIPHAKSDAITEAAVIVVKDESGVTGWDTMDGAPVNVAIALLIPGAQAGTTHLKILSKVAEALMDEDFRATVKGSTDAAEIAKTINARLV